MERTNTQQPTSGIILPVEFFDPVINHQFKVVVSERFTTISIGNRSYYFNPDGSFDGTGLSINDDIANE